MTAQYTAHARSNNPVFDSLVSQIQPAKRPLTPITTSTRIVNPDTAPLWMQAPKANASTATTSPSKPATRSSSTATAAAAPAHSKMPTVAAIISEPLTVQQLTNEEREIIAEMGGTVARLILQMLHDEQPGALHR
jgi:hypothetical protein